MIPFLRNAHQRQSYRTRKMPGVGCRATANESRVSFWGDDDVLDLDGGDGRTICNYIKNRRIVSFKWLNCMVC